MESKGVSTKVWTAAIALVGVVIGHYVTLLITYTSTESEESIKVIETKATINLQKEKQAHEIAASKQQFVHDIIQRTLESGSVEEQISNLRAYAEIGIIAEPYKKAILDLEPEKLPRNSSVERILGVDTSLNLSSDFINKLLATSNAVGLVSLRSQFQANGFVIEPGLLVTSGHVISNVTEAEVAEILLTLHDDSKTVGDRFGLEPHRFFVRSEVLDYTIVAISPRSKRGTSLSVFGTIEAKKVAGKILIGEPITSIQQYSDAPKQFSLRESRIVDVQESYIHYTSQTSLGSSGAPMLNDNLDLIAVHHSRVPNVDSDGRILLRDGSVWEQGEDHAGIDWIAKEGVRWSSIVDDLERRSASARTEKERRIYDQILGHMP